MVADPEHLARLALVVVAAVEHQAGVPAAPGAHRVVADERREQALRVLAGDARRQVLRRDASRRRQRHHALDDPLQLPHVARPVVGRQRVDRGRRQVDRSVPGLSLDEVVREQQDVRTPLAQRRHADLQPAQAVVQVGPKALAGDEVAQALVGRDHQPRVERPRDMAADTFDRHLLDRAQQLRLSWQREIGNLVEEQRTAVRELELAGPTAHAGGCAILDAEELGLQQGLNQRCAVDGYERASGAGALLMDRSCHELLPGPALSFHENGEARRRHPADFVAETYHRRAGTDERRRGGWLSHG